MHICQLKQGDETLRSAISTLQSGGLVVCPSDTVYGLLVDATNPEAVSKLIAFKNRPAGKPISIFTADLTMANQYVVISDQQKSLLTTLLPGPFTIILPARGNVDARLISELDTLGIRIPQFPFIQHLVTQYGKPITATSANVASQHPHYSAQSLLKSLSHAKKEMIDLLIDAGELPRNKPSTVVDLTKDKVHVLRQGDVKWAQSTHVISHAPEETVSLGERIIDRIQKREHNNPTVIILKGELGAGKTILVKGMAKAFDIDRIISPTYVIAAEYPIQHAKGWHVFHHLDLYAIQSDEELQYIGLSQMLKPGHLVCIEWGDKAGALHTQLNHADIVYVTLGYISECERSIDIAYGW